MKFPNLVYRCPGPHHASTGTYDYRAVKNSMELDAAIKDGWSETLPEAVEKTYGVNTAIPTIFSSGSSNHELDEIEEVLGKEDDTTPPTRAELEIQAAELGIKFSKNISDEKLAERIDEALEG